MQSTMERRLPRYTASPRQMVPSADPKGEGSTFGGKEYQKLGDSLLVLVLVLVKHTSSFTVTSIMKYHKLSGSKYTRVFLFVPERWTSKSSAISLEIMRIKSAPGPFPSFW